jgi:DNA-binding NarL/FixJ family response regulator
LLTWTAPKSSEVQNRKLDLRVTGFSNDHDIGILKKCARLGAQGYCFQFDDPPIIFETTWRSRTGPLRIPYIDINKVNTAYRRERELLAMLSDGWTNLQIATRTRVSENTVKYHLKNLYGKLGVRNRAMTARSIRAKSVETPNRPSTNAYCQKCAAVSENMPQNKS